MREIYLTSYQTESGEDNGVDFRMSSIFYEDLHKLERESLDPIVIHLQTIGGEWADGMGIYDVMKFSKCPIHIIGHGNVCSMGTLIFQAADKRLLMPHCDFMVHFGSLAIEGSQLAVESNIEYYTKTKEHMIDLYAEKCVRGPYFKKQKAALSKVRDFLIKKMEKRVDWYLTPDEAVEYGFADAVLTKTTYNNVRQIGKSKARDPK